MFYAGRTTKLHRHLQQQKYTHSWLLYILNKKVSVLQINFPSEWEIVAACIETDCSTPEPQAQQDILDFGSFLGSSSSAAAAFYSGVVFWPWQRGWGSLISGRILRRKRIDHVQNKCFLLSFGQYFLGAQYEGYKQMYTHFETEHNRLSHMMELTIPHKTRLHFSQVYF